MKRWIVGQIKLHVPDLFFFFSEMKITNKMWSNQWIKSSYPPPFVHHCLFFFNTVSASVCYRIFTDQGRRCHHIIYTNRALLEWVCVCLFYSSWQHPLEELSTGVTSLDFLSNCRGRGTDIRRFIVPTRIPDLLCLTMRNRS